MIDEVKTAASHQHGYDPDAGSAMEAGYDQNLTLTVLVQQAKKEKRKVIPLIHTGLS